MEGAATRTSQTMGMSQAVGAFSVRCDASVLFWAVLADRRHRPAPSVTWYPIPVLFADGFESGGTRSWQ